MITVTSAKTTFKNTPETDLMPEVWHTVDYTTDKSVGTAYIMAKDPQDAINRINRLKEDEVERYSTYPSNELYR